MDPGHNTNPSPTASVCATLAWLRAVAEAPGWDPPLTLNTVLLTLNTVLLTLNTVLVVSNAQTLMVKDGGLEMAPLRKV
jgi:hypothetical protein